jgi:endonuclease YncB( thermonuclease family)
MSIRDPAALTRALIAAIALALVASSAFAAGPRHHAPWVSGGSVARVFDGDTFDLRTEDRGVVRVRFAGIDAPERGQAYSRKSAEHLQSLVQGRAVRVRCYKDDGNAREICDVDVEGRDVGLAMIDAGLAWHFKRFEKEQEEGARRAYAAAEERARAARVGLWAHSEPPMAPWECRQSTREGRGCR